MGRPVSTPATARMAVLVAIAFTVAAPAPAQESAPLDPAAAVVVFAERGAVAADFDFDVDLAGPVRIHPKPPEDIPPSLHEKIRLLMVRLDNAYPDASDARKLHFIADYLDIDFRRLWNAYHPDRPQRPDARPDTPPTDARPVDIRPVDIRPVDRVRPDRVRPVDPQRVRPAAVTRVRPAVRPAPTARPTRPRG